MKRALFISLLFLAACGGTSPDLAPAVVRDDTAWHFINTDRGWEAYITASHYTFDTVIRNGKQKIELDTSFMIAVSYKDTAGQVFTKWAEAPPGAVGIKIQR